MKHSNKLKRKSTNIYSALVILH